MSGRPAKEGGRRSPSDGSSRCPVSAPGKFSPSVFCSVPSRTPFSAWSIDCRGETTTQPSGPSSPTPPFTPASPLASPAAPGCSPFANGLTAGTHCDLPPCGANTSSPSLDTLEFPSETGDTRSGFPNNTPPGGDLSGGGVPFGERLAARLGPAEPGLAGEDGDAGAEPRLGPERRLSWGLGCAWGGDSSFCGTQTINKPFHVSHGWAWAVVWISTKGDREGTGGGGG